MTSINKCVFPCTWEPSATLKVGRMIVDTQFFRSAELNRDYITDLVGFSIRFRESSPSNDIDFDERYFFDVNEFKLYSHSKTLTFVSFDHANEQI